MTLSTQGQLGAGGLQTARIPRFIANAGVPPFRDDRSQWLLVAKHRSGSLEMAIAEVRQRNLGVSFGIVLLLGASTVMLVLSGASLVLIPHIVGGLFSSVAGGISSTAAGGPGAPTP